MKWIFSVLKPFHLISLSEQFWVFPVESGNYLSADIRLCAKNTLPRNLETIQYLLVWSLSGKWNFPLWGLLQYLFIWRIGTGLYLKWKVAELWIVYFEWKPSKNMRLSQLVLPVFHVTSAKKNYSADKQKFCLFLIKIWLYFGIGYLIFVKKKCFQGVL